MIVFKSHYGHTTSLGHLWLQESEIIAQLSQGIDFQQILDNIRDSVGRDFNNSKDIDNKY